MCKYLYLVGRNDSHLSVKLIRTIARLTSLNIFLPLALNDKNQTLLVGFIK